MIVFQVITNSDKNEGKGEPLSLGYFADVTRAVAAAKGEGVWGADADVFRLELFESVDEIVRQGSLARRRLVHGRNGWAQPSDDPRRADPDWEEYRRLRVKFGDASA